MNSKITKNKPLISIILSIIVFIVVFILSDFFYLLNEKVKLGMLKSKNEIIYSYSKDSLVNKNIVLVGIDERTLDETGFPLPRRDYAKFIENANNAGAAVIGFDIFFANENKLDPEGDKILAKSIKEAGNIVLGGPITSKGVLEKAIEEIQEGAFAFGYYKPNVNPLTNTVSSFTPTANLNEENNTKKQYDQFSISILKAYFSKLYNQDFVNYKKTDDNFYYIKPGYRVPYYASNKKSVLINFLPPDKVKFYSFLDVYENNIKKDEFKDKIIILGATAKGIKDVFTTPNGVEYGVTVHANIVNTLLTKNYLLYLNKNLEIFLIFLLIVMSIYFNLSRSGFVLIFSNISVSIIFLFIFPLFILVYTNLVLNFLVELIFSLVLSLTVSNIFKYLTENKNKVLLNKALSEYVSKAVANEILTSSGEINLNGENKKLAIYFSDIEGFTTISEKFEPEELVGFLREYLAGMSDVIMDEKGFINKYEGDAIMGLWGSFAEYDNGAYHSCISALKQRDLLIEMNKLWSKRGFNEIKVRIGLHVGNAIVGNIGSSGRKMEYTALGDNVNLASRLEGVNKFYGTYICVSEDTYNETKDNFEYRYLDKIRVKGKENSIKIYELLDIKGNISEERIKLRNNFLEAVDLYLNRDFIKAKEIFTKLYENGDNPSRTYLDMCELYLINPPKKDWDGVSTMTGK